MKKPVSKALSLVKDLIEDGWVYDGHIEESSSDSDGGGKRISLSIGFKRKPNPTTGSDE